MEDKELRFISASIPLNLYDSWVEVVERCIKEIMRVTLCLPSEILMLRESERVRLLGPNGAGYEVKQQQQGDIVWFDGVPIVNENRKTREVGKK